jgi:hypothetical protein
MKKGALLVSLLVFACKAKEEQTAPVVSESKAAASAEPTDLIYAASAHLRIVDAKAGRVVKHIDMQKAVRNLVFSRDGARAYVAASDGVREIDADKQEITAKLSELPARNVELSEDGSRLYVLQHQVIVHPDETREILPFHLLTIDVEKRALISDEEIGQRVLYAHPATKDRFGVVAFENGQLRKIAPGAKLSSEGVAIEHGGRVREGSVVHDGKLYVPIEAADGSRVLAIDLVKGEPAVIQLDRPYSLRGLAITGERLWVNAGVMLLAIDLKTQAIAKTIELPAAHAGISISSDGRYAYLAQTVDGTGGAVSAVDLNSLQSAKKIHLDDISPWALAVRPRR